MLNNFLTDEEETWGNRDLDLQKDAENNKDRIYNQQESFKENGNKGHLYSESAGHFVSYIVSVQISEEQATNWNSLDIN